MNSIPFYNPSHGQPFPEDTIIKEIDHAGGFTTYYVFVGRTLVHVKRIHRSGPHYREIRELKEKHGSDLDVKRHWNPLDYRIDDYRGYKSDVETPAEFVEMKSHEYKYAERSD